MMDAHVYTTVALSSLAGVAMVTAAGLSGWRGWLRLKQLELGDRRPSPDAHPMPTGSAASRIEIADLKERIRKLEAIAAGVDL
ncbi:hypothetical protein [Sphingomonas sp.]|uniref:hypothetical protein n=1 Tax=Sphingomonas sp. TaxID=28214 RepID=UPI001B2EDA82|nr:hypothetical protein [Sphingomonas sp.]MBO9712940.1 hypothetical protein [Sphingomonas sp.]